MNNFFRALMIWGGIAALIVGAVISLISFLFSAEAGATITFVYLVFSVVIYFTVYRRAFNKEKLLKQGIRAQAKIIKIEETIWSEGTDGNSHPVFKFTIEVTPPNGMTYQTTFRDTRINTFQKAYRQSIPLTVLINPQNPNNILIEKAGNMVVDGKADQWDEAMNELPL
jgi:hypothetical protein